MCNGIDWRDMTTDAKDSAKETSRFLVSLAHRHQDQAWTIGTRLRWGGLLSNGGAILALCGIIGNVDKPDAALTAFTPALAIFSLGILAGGLANLSYQAAFALSAQSLAATATGMTVNNKYNPMAVSADQAVEFHRIALRRRDLSRILQFISLICCLVGLSVVLISHSYGGMIIQPADTSAPIRSPAQNYPRKLTATPVSLTQAPTDIPGANLPA